MLWLMVSRVYRRCCRPRCCSGKIFSAKVAVIDAEYRLIQQHEPSRREAAVRHAASAPAAFRRFQVRQRRRAGGRSRCAAGRLRRFPPHPLRRPANAALAAGPQSLEALGELAGPFRRRACRRRGSAAGAAAAPWASSLHCSWRSPASPRCGAGPLIALSDNVTLLREFLLDEAPGSLMASLRQRRLAGDCGAELAVSGSAPRLAGAGLRQRPAGRGRPADNPLAAGATANDA
ncbi:pyrroloquinoline quinone biosynthesis protein F-like protein [Klebsiella pneumoniae]|uniref:Pyrroloquinoline quinone biosynthesis protein F-like protein n=1 Tax=Klebsiella pneumoniae TaxID=573 RepID=A0A2X3DFF8_KLEPN|nr:pyrroloquinoline quinone biosynthesis protein F-like protein [Klebsiella pneumoniae]